MEIIEVVIRNKSFGKLDGSKAYFVKTLYDKLAVEKTKRDKIPLIDLFKQGRALQGLKHLLELIKASSRENKVIFTEAKTSKDGSNYYINYQEYRQKAQGRFYSLYRATGLDTAKSYLNIYFSEEFPYKNIAVTEKELKHTDKNFPEVIKELSQKAKHKKALVGQTAEVLKNLREEKKVLSNDIEALKELQKQSSISYYQQRHDELKTRLQKKFSETKGKNSWQTWIYSNRWIFGIHYQTPIQKEKVGFNSIPDYLFPTLDGFVDILEIKKPDCQVILPDSSHTGSYMWSGVVNEAIGQVVNYIHEIELNQLQIQKKLKQNYADLFKNGIFTIKPRAFILVGNSENWKESEKEALRKLNYSLHGIEVLTYFDILQRAEKIISMYTDKNFT
ncbi:MAG: hypothetical protein A3C27_00615 [Candidatus Levybacteria bacterium RIFCSPHIGHO2_02_FULL_39_36]|nr:MAG: hypothetical protein A3E11_01330 [Candidatus Curtissbacteria bacterium RIFCSPHIGHO2_12_FULL_38_37]OGH28317.1 MAG: hypothetical protein A3C27_00615 [Candidatus Levybacteria bacterium RIFCSPHIGHO2_02_FULL_39_36]